jgi:DNA adenine methylase
MILQAPFPYFGGKSRVAPEAWSRFGHVANYVEPFAGSLAVLLARPDEPGTETVNDLDGLLVNFWRSVATDPSEVAHHADWPVSELDLQARHAYLVKRVPWLTERLGGDPSFCDPKLAGWWVWGACAWIGSGWCSGGGPWVESGGVLVHRSEVGSTAPGVSRRLPHGGDGGRGINRQLPHLGTPGAGINRKLPHLGDAGLGINRAEGRRALSTQGEAIAETMERLQARLRRVRITCGDWTRVLTPVVTSRHGLTGIFLDPPYAEGEMSYSAGAGAVAPDVAAWARENGSDPLLRIALCGHDGEHDLPGWSVHHWKARGGYGNAGGEDAEDNRHRETVWFSPHCLAARQSHLFSVT